MRKAYISFCYFNFNLNFYSGCEIGRAGILGGAAGNEDSFLVKDCRYFVKLKSGGSIATPRVDIITLHYLANPRPIHEITFAARSYVLRKCTSYAMRAHSLNKWMSFSFRATKEFPSTYY